MATRRTPSAPTPPDQGTPKTRRFPARLIALAVAFAAAAALIGYGVAMVHQPSGVIVGGVLLAGYAYLVLGEVRE